jgi:hypothetical protein
MAKAKTKPARTSEPAKQRVAALNDKSVASKVGNECLAAAKLVAESYGLHFEMKGGRYTATNLILKFELSVVSEDGVPRTREAGIFSRDAKLVGLAPEDLGKEFLWKGERYVVRGLRPRSSKRPVTCERVSNGRLFNFSATAVAAALQLARRATRR